MTPFFASRPFNATRSLRVTGLFLIAVASIALTCDTPTGGLRSDFSDNDGNGLADDFEMIYGDLDPSADDDGDGISNEQESALLTDPLVPSAAIPNFPGAEGFGTYAFGGRGDGSGQPPRIIKVTTLADKVPNGLGGFVTAPGSLREALEASGPRFIVFEVHGVIFLEEPIRILNPFVTVAGQTAGGDGIVLAHQPLIVRTQDVVLRHLRMRILYEKGDPDATLLDGITIFRNDFEANSAQQSVYNFIIDHCSISWAIDKNVSTWNWVRNFTIQWSIISEASLFGNPQGPTGFGMLAAPTPGGLTPTDLTYASLHHNLFVHNSARNPLIAEGKLWDFRNNVEYNWNVAQPAQFEFGASVNFIGNRYIPGLDTSFAPPEIRNLIDINSPDEGPLPRIFLRDNLAPLRTSTTQDDWDVGVAYVTPNVGGLCGGGASVCNVFITPGHLRDQVELPNALPAPPVTTYPVEEATTRVLDGAGATKPRRDAVDTALVNELRYVVDNNLFVDSQPVGDPNLRRIGPHHGEIANVLWFRPNADPTILCRPRQYRMEPGQTLAEAKLAMLAQMTCTIDGIVLPGGAAQIIADPVKYPFVVVQRVIPDRNTLNGLYVSNNSPPLPTDTDGDYIPNNRELEFGGDPNVADSLTDSNGNGYLNIEEYLSSLAGDPL